jgi:uncharacterized membrane protein YvbJ
MSLKVPSHPKPKGGHPEFVTCARCEHRNSDDFKTCEKCGAHLYVTCHNCGGRNARAATRCNECGMRLHRTFLRKFLKKFQKTSRYISFGQLLLLAIGVGLAFLLILFINGLRLPI